MAINSYQRNQVKFSTQKRLGAGMFAEGNGSYVVDIDGQVILVGGRFRTEEISHEILVGVEAIMSEADHGFLDAHNSRRQ
eukprot:scaffold2488_cov78-Skeletonema_dohrnii-CCMP3373.AAC.1